MGVAALVALKDGDDFCGSTWISNPPDGVLCLVATRRTLDINGHCCDYARCASTKQFYNYARPDRCILLPGHQDTHLGGSGRYW